MREGAWGRWMTPKLGKGVIWGGGGGTPTWLADSHW